MQRNRPRSALRTVAVGGALFLALPLSACSSPLEDGLRACEDDLQYEIEQMYPDHEGGWLDVEGLEVSDVTSTQRPNYELGTAYDHYGTATVSFEDGRENVVAKWQCFSQTVEGTTYHSVQKIDGECSTVRREARPELCS